MNKIKITYHKFNLLELIFIKNLKIKYIIFYPLYIIYLAILNIRNFLFDKNILKPKISLTNIISIGNITLGGSGKTPLINHIANKLKKENKVCAIITRDFKDEISLLKNNHNYIYSHNKKYKALKQAINSNINFDYYLVDDGFQHRHIKAGINILLIDLSQDIFNSKLFPLGILREPIKNIKRANIIILTRSNLYKGNISNVKQKIINITKNPQINIIESTFETSIDIDIKNKDVLLFCSIGNPLSFLYDIKNLNANVKRFLIFKDHYQYKEKDLLMIKKEAQKNNVDYIITTKKDLVKVKNLQIFENKLHILDIKFKIKNEDDKQIPFYLI